MKTPFQKDHKRKLDLESLEDWPKNLREEQAAAASARCGVGNYENTTRNGKEDEEKSVD